MFVVERTIYLQRIKNEENQEQWIRLYERYINRRRFFFHKYFRVIKVIVKKPEQTRDTVK